MVEAHRDGDGVWLWLSDREVALVALAMDYYHDVYGQMARDRHGAAMDSVVEKMRAAAPVEDRVAEFYRGQRDPQVEAYWATLREKCRRLSDSVAREASR